MTWTPGFPLVLAEEMVDYQAHLDHLLERRAQLEDTGAATARRIGATVAQHGAPSLEQMQRLARLVEQSLASTARFGYQSAQTEIRALRDRYPLQPDAALALEFQDVGQYGEAASGGLEAIRRVLARRGRQTADTIASRARDALDTADPVLEPADREILASTAAARAMHNAAIELVGEALNLGRTAGASALPDPPRYAMRSEQLDKRTCAACTALHGEITEINSPDYFEKMPPAGCFGGGRCRGLYIYGDDRPQLGG